MEDKVKHRIVGAVVIAAFLIILVPALIKKVSWHSETAENKSMIASSVPEISSPQSFQTSEIAQVSLNNNATSESTPATSMPADTTAVASIPEPIESQSITAEGTTQPAITATTVAPTTATTAAATSTTMATSEPVAAPAPMPITPAPTPVVITAPPPPAPIKAKVLKPVVTVKKTIVIDRTTPHAPVKVVKTVTVKKAVVIKKNPTVMGPTNNYCLQMGAFANPSNANLLVQRLKARGFSSAHSTTITLPSGITVHKVSLCKRMTPSEAIALRDRLILLNRTPIIMVRT